MTLMIFKFICIEKNFSQLVSGVFGGSKGQGRLSIWQIWCKATLFPTPDSKNLQNSCKVEGIY